DLGAVTEEKLMFGVLRVDSVHEQRVGSVQLDVRLVGPPGRVNSSIVGDVLSLRAHAISTMRTVIVGQRAELGVLVDHALSHNVEAIMRGRVHP
ncbi:hypothetical protein PENTCL1PPCAC_21532, partial [Pristionchus entomophagus]